ncbi:MAG: ABC transporter permease, partial [Lachnospiraceae bacterium]|nr:ABC transporter permease [Lachnospiraceae bacterium]
MISVMRNTYTLFRKNKELIYLITIQPIMIFLLMSFLLPYKSTHDIVVSKESDSEAAAMVLENLQALEGVSVREIDAEKITEKLIGGNAELAILITDSAESDIPIVDLISVGGSEVEDAVELCVNETLEAYRNHDIGAGVEVSVNAAPKKWISISNSLAFMIFKTLTAGNLLGALIIEERRNRMKDRIMLSGVKKSSYLLGMALVYLVFMMIGSVSYYLVGLLLNFDFGMRNSLGF